MMVEVYILSRNKHVIKSGDLQQTVLTPNKIVEKGAQHEDLKVSKSDTKYAKSSMPS